jgi:hypothetical protein
VEVYNETAFRHFLRLERRRAERLGRSVLLMLVDVRGDERPGGTALDQSTADRIMGVLARCVREVDFVGWYRAQRIAGAVLAQGDGGPAPDVLHGIGARAAARLKRDLPQDVVERTQVRVLQLRSTGGETS